MMWQLPTASRRSRPTEHGTRKSSTARWRHSAHPASCRPQPRLRSARRPHMGRHLRHLCRIRHRRTRSQDRQDPQLPRRQRLQKSQVRRLRVGRLRFQRRRLRQRPLLRRRSTSSPRVRRQSSHRPTLGLSTRPARRKLTRTPLAAMRLRRPLWRRRIRAVRRLTATVSTRHRKLRRSMSNGRRAAPHTSIGRVPRLRHRLRRRPVMLRRHPH